MALFGLGKKKEETKSLCCCGGTCTPDTMEKAEEKKTGMGVKVLGGGCAKCNQLEAATVEALTELGMDTTIEHIKDWGEIASYGVMTTPALVIDGKVGKGCNSININMTSGVCLGEETYAAYLRQKLIKICKILSKTVT